MNVLSGMGSKSKHNFHIASASALILFFCVTLPAQTKEELRVYAERLQFGETEVKRNTLRDLRNIKTESASRAAVPALRDISEVVRATAAGSVIFLPHVEAVQVLIPLLDDRSAFVRREAAHALGNVGDSSAARRLITSLLSDKEMEVKTASARALGEIGDISAIPALTGIVLQKPKESRNFLRRAAAHAIGKIAQNVQLQNPTSTTPESFLPEKYKEINKPKFPVLTEAFPVFAAANSALIRAISQKHVTADFKREAAFALGEIGDKTAIPVLNSLLRSNDYYLKEICEEALRKVYAAINHSNSDSPSAVQKTQN
ncbi:MAG: HEAT repeat domain-containing protein [Pyrinomonadaceae bacterium]